MKYEFWKDWKRKTKLEESAIKSLKAGKEILLSNLPKDKIVSIYVKGSFVRRELNKNSDVDIMVIVKKSKDLDKLEKLNNKFSKQFQPNLNISGYSTWELKTGRRCKTKSRKGLNRPHPIKLIVLLPEHKLIYGKPIDKNKLIKRAPKEDVEGMIESFEKVLLPTYRKKIIDFDFLVKQVLWITYDEQRVKTKNPPIEWRKLAKSIKNKKHIVHDALKYRLKPTKDKKLRKAFITKLKKHLKQLEKLTK